MSMSGIAYMVITLAPATVRPTKSHHTKSSVSPTSGKYYLHNRDMMERGRVICGEVGSNGKTRQTHTKLNPYIR